MGVSEPGSLRRARDRWPRAPDSRSPTTIPISRHAGELADKGFLVAERDDADQLGAHRLADVDDVRAGLLRGRDDAGVDAALRSRAFRLRAARLPAPVRRDDRRRHADQQDGAGAAQGLRPDAGAALCDLDGLLRQWRRLLPLFLCGGARLRPHRAGGHLCAGLPADRRGAASTASCCCSGKSAAPARSSAEAWTIARRPRPRRSPLRLPARGDGPFDRVSAN